MIDIGLSLGECVLKKLLEENIIDEYQFKIAFKRVRRKLYIR